MTKVLKVFLISLAILIVLVNLLILFLKYCYYPYKEARKNITIADSEIQPSTLNIAQKTGYIYCPILLYHHIAKKEPQDSYYVSPETFAKQMQWISENGYSVITYDDFYLAMSKKKTLPEKPVVITLDDGTTDNYDNAFPILKKLGFSAMFFIKLNNIGPDKGGLTWEMLKKMRDGGMEIGSHSVNHDNMKMLDNNTLRTELFDSKKTLEDNLGVDIKYFAYPGGAFNITTETQTKDAGYLSAVTTKHEVYHKIGGDLFAVSRIHIDDELPTFIDWIQGKNLY